MTLENVITTVLSVEFLFGASTALAFERGVRELFGSVFGRASARTDGEQDNDGT